MKKLLTLLYSLLLLAAAVSQVFSQEPDRQSKSSESIISVSLTPAFSRYMYTVNISGGDIYEGGLNVLAAEYEYRFAPGAIMNSGWPSVGIIGFVEMTGHLYEGHEDSSFWLNQIWGLVNAKIGAGIRISRGFGNFELNASGAVYFVEYFADFDELWPGVGVRVDSRLLYYFNPKIGAGINIFINYSTHEGGPLPSNPSVTHYPFEIIEYGGGLTVSIKI